MDRGDRMDARQGIPQEFYNLQTEIIEDEELRAQTLSMVELMDALERLKTQFDLSASGGPAFSFTEENGKTVMEWVEIVRERTKTADISHILAQKIESYLKKVEKYAKKNEISKHYH